MRSASCASSIRAVVLERIRPRVRELDENCDYPHDIHETLAQEGLMGLALPAEYGGRDASEVSWCAYVEELAKVSGTVSLMAAYVKLVALPILIAGTEEQKREYLPPLVSGERYGSYALTEPAVGSDPAALQTRAERHGDTWVLNGEKRFIGNAGHADTYVVFARTGDAGAGGISAFVVDGKAPGPERRAAADDGDAGVEAGRAEVRGRRGAAREPARPRGRRLQDRDDDLRPLAADGRRAGGRRGAGRDRPRDGLRGAARDDGRDAARAPGHPVQARRAWRPTSRRRAR